MGMLLIEMQYLGSIEYYKQLLKYRNVCFEQHENFVKSTYRNRCYIAGPNGRLRLSIPILNGKGQRAKFGDIKIAYEHNWQKEHWFSLCSSYRRSPYFEFYEDYFYPFFHKQFVHLYEFNQQLMQLILKLLKMDLTISYTGLYEKQPNSLTVDFRSSINPTSIADARIGCIQYNQVFQGRNGFLPNMSIVDLLFNEGPQALNFLN